MKKLLSLLLAMILCLGVLVACNDEDESLEVDASKNATVQYYYHETISEELDAPFEYGVVFVETYNEFINFAEERTTYSYKIGTSINEQLFDGYYLLRVTRGYCEGIGYRSFKSQDDGGKSFSIIFDKLSFYDDKHFRNGKIVYGSWYPDNDSSAQETKTYKAYYDFVLIPKNEVTINSFDEVNVEIYTLTYKVQN